MFHTWFIVSLVGHKQNREKLTISHILQVVTQPARCEIWSRPAGSANKPVPNAVQECNTLQTTSILMRAKQDSAAIFKFADL